MSQKLVPCPSVCARKFNHTHGTMQLSSTMLLEREAIGVWLPAPAGLRTVKVVVVVVLLRLFGDETGKHVTLNRGL